MDIKLFTALMLPALVACSGAEGDCETSTYQCDGTVLQQCGEDGVWDDQEDCADLNMMCHAEMGHCMAEDDSHDDSHDSGSSE